MCARFARGGGEMRVRFVPGGRGAGVSNLYGGRVGGRDLLLLCRERLERHEGEVEERRGVELARVPCPPAASRPRRVGAGGWGERCASGFYGRGGRASTERLVHERRDEVQRGRDRRVDLGKVVVHVLGVLHLAERAVGCPVSTGGTRRVRLVRGGRDVSG